MNIRKATEADLHKLGRLWLAMGEELEPDMTTPHLEMWKTLTKISMMQDGFGLFVADDGGRIVGFASVYVMPEPESGKAVGILRYFYVIPEERRRGVGGQLYYAVEDFAKEKRAVEIKVSCGFSQQYIYKAEKFNIDGLTMKKKLIYAGGA